MINPPLIMVGTTLVVDTTLGADIEGKINRLAFETENSLTEVKIGD